MDNKFETILSPEAQEDIKNAYHYISEELKNTSAAEYLIQNIDRKLDVLETFPLIGKVLEDQVGKPLKFKETIRVVPINNYQLFY